MQGIIFDIKKYAVHDGEGIRTTIFLKGCPLDCLWCHNPESKNPAIETLEVFRETGSGVECEHHTFGRKVTTTELIEEIEKDTIFYDVTNGGVTFSGGEPLMQPDFLMELLKACREMEVHTIVDTSGYAQWKVIEKILPYVDLFYYDIKFIDEGKHRDFTGVSNKIILENLIELGKKSVPIVIRIPLIPGFTDTTENIREIAEFLKRFTNPDRIDLLPFNQFAMAKFKRFNLKQPLMHIKNPVSDNTLQLKRYFEDLGFYATIEGI